MKGLKKASLRLLSLALALAIMLALPLTLRAAAAPAQEAAPPASDAPPLGGFVGLPTLRYNSRDKYFYHTKNSYQWMFGFNKAYDTFSPLVGALYTTRRFEFNYGGRDWLLQVWKGAYAYRLYTGGEIGLYSKSPKTPVKQYTGATKKDYIGMEFSIYNRQDKLFTRPMEDSWWVTGFKKYILKDGNRTNLSMEATLRFKSEGMAAAFAKAMADKGFASAANATISGGNTTNRYNLSGNTVRFLWRTGAD